MNCLDTLSKFLEKYYGLGIEHQDSFVIKRECSAFENLEEFISDAQKNIKYWGPYAVFKLELRHNSFDLDFDLNRTAGAVVDEYVCRDIPANHFEGDALLAMNQLGLYHRNKTVIPLKTFNQFLSVLLGSGFTCYTKFSLDKMNTIIDVPHLNLQKFSSRTLVFFDMEKMTHHLKDISLENFRREFLKKEKLLIFVRNEMKYAYGNYIGIFGLSHIGEFSEKVLEFLKKKNEPPTKKLKSLSEVSFIDKIDYVTPPDCFQAEEYGDTRDKEVFDSIFAPFSIIFALIFLSSKVNFESDSRWVLSIHGNRIIENSIWHDKSDNKVKILLHHEKIPVEIPLEHAADLMKLYEWIFREHNIEKVFLSRKIISISVSDFYQIVENSQSVFSTIISNWNFYLDKSIDKFIDFRQNFTDYLFNHSQELIKFHSTLSSHMSDTSFKIFGYLLVFLLGWQEKASESQYEPYYLILGLFFLLLYLLFSLRRLREMEEDYRGFDTQHSRHLRYFRRFVDAQDYEMLTEDRKKENENFFSKYRFYLSLLYIFLLLDGTLILYFVAVFLK